MLATSNSLTIELACKDLFDIQNKTNKIMKKSFDYGHGANIKKRSTLPRLNTRDDHNNLLVDLLDADEQEILQEDMNNKMNNTSSTPIVITTSDNNVESSPNLHTGEDWVVIGDENNGNIDNNSTTSTRDDDIDEEEWVMEDNDVCTSFKSVLMTTIAIPFSKDMSSSLVDVSNVLLPVINKQKEEDHAVGDPLAIPYYISKELKQKTSKKRNRGGRNRGNKR
jgi:hypothetical protein